MTFQPAWGHDGKNYTGKDMRQAIAIAGRGLVGVASLADLTVAAQSTPNNTVKVGPGRALINASAAGLFGNYAVSNDGDVNSPAFTATGAQARTDRVILRVDSSGNVNIEIVAGTPGAGTPPPPTVTGNNFLVLARVQIPASTSNITSGMIVDERVALPQGAMRLPPTELLFWPAALGDINTDAASKIQSFYDGAGWVPNNNNIVARQKLTGSSSAYSGDVNTDFVLASLAMKASRLYKAHLHANWNTSAPATFLVNLTEDGTVVGQLETTDSARDTIDATVLLEPSTGNHTYRIALDEVVAGGTFAFSATGTTPRWFWIEDIGPR